MIKDLTDLLAQAEQIVDENGSKADLRECLDKIRRLKARGNSEQDLIAQTFGTLHKLELFYREG